MKKRILSLLTTCALLSALALPAAAAGLSPFITYAREAEDTALTLTLDGLDQTTVYAVQLELPITTLGTNLTFQPDDGLTSGNPSLFHKLEIQQSGENQTAILYLDSKVPLNTGASVTLGYLASSDTLSAGSQAKLTLVDGMLQNTRYSAVSVTKDGEPPTPVDPDEPDEPDVPTPDPDPAPNPDPGPDDGGGSGGGGSSGGGSSQSGKALSVTPKQGTASVTKRQLTTATQLEVKGDAVLSIGGSALQALKDVGADVDIRSASVAPADTSRSVRAQLNGAALYELSFTSKGSAVPMEDGTIQVSVSFQGKGQPVAYLVSDCGMERLGAVSLERGTATFSLPSASSARVAVVDITHSFTDLNGWYEGYVNTVATAGVMTGVSSDRFQPDTVMTRAELVTTLSSLSGDEMGGDAVFADVPSDAWFAPYVAWAKRSGVVSGVSQTEFAPNGTITREQMAVILVRFAEYQGIDLGHEVESATFPDGAQISSYAASAVSLMQQADILVGRDNGQIDPQGGVTRAECARMLSIVLQAKGQ